jgi:hypothetical protein
MELFSIKPIAIKHRRLMRQSADKNASVAAILAKTPETIAVISIPTSALARPSHVIAIFEPTARPPKHPQGAAFVVFSNHLGAVTYLGNIFKVDTPPSVDDDSTSPMVFTSFTLVGGAQERHIEDGNQSTVAPLTSPARQRLLYESSADLIQARSQIVTLERELSEHQLANARLHSEVSRSISRHQTSDPVFDARQVINHEQRARDFGDVSRSSTTLPPIEGSFS